jgi:UDP-glucose 4,6-dehydratase
MNLLVTGGCGFIGSNFINYFIARYGNKLNKLVNIDAMYYCASESNIKPFVYESERYHFVKGNLCSSDLVSHILEEHQITHVIHFAAQSHVQNSFDDSMQYTKDNVFGTHTLLECCKKYQLKKNKIEKIIHISTDEVYGESGNDKFDENTLLVPTNPYAATKAAAEMIAMSYIKSYNLPIIITRGNNVYGPNQYPEKMIPLFIKQLKSNEKITIQGDGSAKRSFLHVLDTCSAFEKILLNGIIGEIYNIGANDESEFTVMEIAKMLVKLIKDTNEFEDHIRFIDDRPFNDSRYFISNQKLKNLGWEIKIPFHVGIKNLIILNE